MADSQVIPTTEQIWRELSDRLRQFVLARKVAPTDADDVLQDVFLRIHQNLGNLDSIGRLESWVFQITRNAVIDHFRRPRGNQPDVAPDVAISDWQEENINSEVASCLRALVEHLPNEQRTAVSLYELQGLSQKEIALRESLSLSGAKSRIQRGRQTLEKLLRDCCEFQFDQRGNVIQWQQNADGACGSGTCGCTRSD